MPGNLLSILVGWLATHLVLLGFLGFGVAGLMVAGVIDWPRVTADGASSNRVAPASEIDEAVSASGPRLAPLDEVAGKSISKPGQALSPTQDATPDGEHRPAPPRKAPKLIGGSIPVYSDPRFAPSAAAAGAAPADDPFRPAVVEGGDPPLAGQMTRDEFVQQARRAYWNGDFEAAEAAYMKMLLVFPGDADAFGELGNLYQSMGRPAQALDAYFEAGLRLKAEGNREKLQQIIELMQKEGDGRGDQLRQ